MVDFKRLKELTAAAKESVKEATPYTRVDIGNGMVEVYTAEVVIDRYKRGANWQRKYDETENQVPRPEEGAAYEKGILDTCEQVQDIMRESKTPEEAYVHVAEFLHQKMEEGGRNF